MTQFISRRQSLCGLAALAAAPLSGCGTWINYEDIGSGDLKGTVRVDWVGEDKFIYRKTSDPLSFRPSFMTIPIVPDEMICSPMAGRSPVFSGLSLACHRGVLDLLTSFMIGFS